MLIACQEFAFWIGEGNRKKKGKECTVHKAGTVIEYIAKIKIL